MASTAPNRPGRPGFWRELLAGIGHLGSGLRLWLVRPRLMLLGAIPAVIVAILLVGALVGLGFSVQGIATWGTPFADGWDEAWRGTLRGLIAVVLFLGGLVLSVVAFTAITLMVGAPFYDRIRLEVDRMHGEPPAPPEVGAWRGFWRAVLNGIRTLLPALLFGIAVLPLGFVPVVGQVLSAVLSAIFGGWFVAVELTGSAADARGLLLRDRRRMLRARLPRTLGLGIATYLLFLVPFGAVFAMPAAVAGATLMVRAVRNEPDARATGDRSAAAPAAALPEAPAGDIPLSTPARPQPLPPNE